VARGWGRSEEDLGAEKEHAREAAERSEARPSPAYAEGASRRRSLELSLARIEELLAKTENPDRRRALETAKAELRERLESLEPPPAKRP
jgi:aconitase A